jgi:hypothetical protein
MGLRVSAYTRSDDGYIDRYAIDPGDYLKADYGKKKDNVNTYQTSGVRAALLIKPDESLSITPSIIYQYARLGSPFTYDKFPASDRNAYQVRDVDERNVQRSMISNLSVVKRFDKVDLTSSTSYFTREFEIRDDSSKVINYFFGLPSVYPVTMYGNYKNKEFTRNSAHPASSTARCSSPAARSSTTCMRRWRHPSRTRPASTTRSTRRSPPTTPSTPARAAPR